MTENESVTEKGVGEEKVLSQRQAGQGKGGRKTGDTGAGKGALMIGRVLEQ